MLLLLAVLQADPDLSAWKELHVAKCGSSAAWGSDGKLLYGSSEKKKKGLIIAWDTGPRSKRADFEGKVETTGGGFIAADAGGQRVFGLVVSKENVAHVEVFQQPRGEYHKAVVFKERLTAASDLRASADGVLVAVTDGQGLIGLGDADDGSVRAVLDARLLGEGPYRCMAWSPDASRLAIGWGNVTMHVWNMREKRVERTIRPQNHTTAVAWRPDGKELAIGTDKGEVELWSLETGQRSATWAGHPAAVTALAYTPQAKWVASGDGKGQLRFWDAAKGSCAKQEDLAGESIRQLRFSPEAKHLAVIGREVRVWGRK